MKVVELETHSGKEPFEAIYRLIGCSRLDIAILADHHLVFMDADSISDGLPCFAELNGCEAPLAGNLLITGTNEDEEVTSPMIPIEAFADRIVIARPVLDPVYGPVSESGTPEICICGFKPRLAHSRPTVIRKVN